MGDILTKMADMFNGEEASYCIVGCGLPGRGMGWFHGLQLVNGDIGARAAPEYRAARRGPRRTVGKAKLTDVVEPWFLGGGKDSPPGVSSGPKVCLIAGRTPDNPKFFRQAIAAGATHILLEKPGAPTVGELEEMAALAKEKGVPVFMGFIKNISDYVEGALAAAAAAPKGADAETLLVSRATTPKTTSAIERAEGCEMLALGGFTDFSKIDFTLVNDQGTKTTPPGAATIEIAIEALKLAEYLTPVLKDKLKA
ncbi:hypothetical protein SO694_00179027 [Aureococcus anophagefferens]|uniref:Gfo/Idh/MocA-like oxidoreductase N-terminal domain-containing protein n=1 Tax=Aureococcus anophagefferens TaxID=44056 RepID=A0ABR1FI91_AURAN